MSEEANTCYRCKGAIETTCVQAGPYFYHFEHFLCTACDNPLSTRRFHERDGFPYCSATCAELGKIKNEAKICCACNKIIEGSIMDAVDKYWHPKCFNCSKCSKNVALINFYETKGEVYCDVCYKKLVNDLFQG